jgi:hypothetical protein
MRPPINLLQSSFEALTYTVVVLNDREHQKVESAMELWRKTFQTQFGLDLFLLSNKDLEKNEIVGSSLSVICDQYYTNNAFSGHQ